MKIPTLADVLANKKLSKKFQITYVLLMLGWLVVGNVIGYHVMSWWIDSKIETYVNTHQCGCK